MIWRGVFALSLYSSYAVGSRRLLPSTVRPSADRHRCCRRIFVLLICTLFYEVVSAAVTAASRERRRRRERSHVSAELIRPSALWPTSSGTFTTLLSNALVVWKWAEDQQRRVQNLSCKLVSFTCCVSLDPSRVTWLSFVGLRRSSILQRVIT